MGENMVKGEGGEAFNADAASGGYIYARADRLSARLSNERMTHAILAMADLLNKRVIDLGCGDGTFSLELARLGKAREVVGIDPATAAVALAGRNAAEQKESRCHFRVGSVYDSSSLDGPYDVAILRGVLHHLDHPEAALATALALADRVVILEPNGLNPVLKLIERLSPYHRAHGERSYLPASLQRWVRNAGGRVCAAKFINLVPMFCPPLLAKACRKMEPMVESIPMVRAFACGQYVFAAHKQKIGPNK